MSASTTSLQPLPATHRESRISLSLWLIVITLLFAYAAPWVIGPGAALSFGGYDLAEWASLPPEVRTQNPPLVTTFLLRFPLAAITLFLAFALPYRRLTLPWLVGGIAVLMLVVAQSPPFEFLTSARNDPNYSQQATLTGISGILALLILLTQPGRWRSLLAAVFAALGAVCTVAGLLSAQALLGAYAISTSISAAGWLTLTLFVFAALYGAWAFVRSYAIPR